MAKQLTIYDKLTETAGRAVWREHGKTYRHSYKIPFSSISILKGWNARTEFVGIEELSKDIEFNGLNEPLEGVMTGEGKFLLLDGERRYRAIQLIRKRGIEFDEVEVRQAPRLAPEDMIVRMLSGGVHKSLYKDVEIANGLLRLKNDFNLTNEVIGQKMGKSRQWVDNMIKLAKQPDEVKEKVANGQLKKTTVVVPMKDKPEDVVSGLTKNKPQPGLPASLKTDNQKAEKESAAPIAAAGHEQTVKAPVSVTGIAGMAPATSVSGKDALQGVNYDKEINEQEAAINRIVKNVNKIESLGKGLNEQGQKDLESYLRFIRTDCEALKTYYSKIKNRQVL